jgi:hypothetical protein
VSLGVLKLESFRRKFATGPGSSQNKLESNVLNFVAPKFIPGLYLKGGQESCWLVEPLAQ